MEPGVAKLIVLGGIIVLWGIKLIFQAIRNSIQNKRDRKKQSSQRPQYAQQRQMYQQPQYVPQYRQQAYQQPLSVQQNRQLPYQQPQSVQQNRQLAYQQPQSVQQNRQQTYQQPQSVQQKEIFHVSIDGHQMGPFNIPQLAQMAKKELFTKQSFVWRQGLSRWMRAVDIPETAVLFTPPQLP